MRHLLASFIAACACAPAILIASGWTHGLAGGVLVSVTMGALAAFFMGTVLTRKGLERGGTE